MVLGEGAEIVEVAGETKIALKEGWKFKNGEVVKENRFDGWMDMFKQDEAIDPRLYRALIEKGAILEVDDVTYRHLSRGYKKLSRIKSPDWAADGEVWDKRKEDLLATLISLYEFCELKGVEIGGDERWKINWLLVESGQRHRMDTGSQVFRDRTKQFDEVVYLASKK